MVSTNFWPPSGKNPNSGVGFMIAFEWEKSYQWRYDLGTLRRKILALKYGIRAGLEPTTEGAHRLESA